MPRYDLSGRDVTDLPGLWSEDDIELSDEADQRLKDSAAELAAALRDLHDFAVVAENLRCEDESRAAFVRAIELLKRVGF